MAALALAIIAVVLVYDDDDGGSSSEGASSDDSSSEGSSSGSDSGSDSSAPTSVDLSAIEFAFEPGSVTVAAGSDVEVNVLNDGAVDHELVILNAGERITAEAEFDESMVLDRTMVLEAGASDSITVNLEPGTYQIVCLVPGHFSAGMEDELEAS
ncbi:MAG: hypothetical protein GY713_03605 [Actinomycetia bacterium]|nr:hypothetical protein [Actinomycetes bacterium]